MPAPVTVLNDDSRMPAAGPPAEPRSPLAGLRVLVVDEDADAACHLGGHLAAAGADVRECRDTRTAAEIWEAFRPHAALVTPRPDETGASAFARRVRTGPGGPGALLVALSPPGGAGDDGRSVAAGFDLRVGTPADPAGVVAILVGFGFQLIRASVPL